MAFRKLAAELLGTALLVFFAVGASTLVFGLELHGGSVAAGVVMSALVVGLVVSALYSALAPVSGCHLNPAVTFGFVVAGRMAPGDGVRYGGAQAIGAVVGAFAMRAVLLDADAYSPAQSGLGVTGWGPHSMIGLHTGGAFVAEVALTFGFVLVFLVATRPPATERVAGQAIAAAVAAVHLVGIPLTGGSVNPARSFGPALLVGGDAVGELWLFVVAPMLGAALAATCARLLVVSPHLATAEPAEPEEKTAELAA